MRFLKSFFSAKPWLSDLQRIHPMRDSFASLSDTDLRQRAREISDPLEVIAVTAVAASRLLKLDMFDTQLQGALALIDGKIAEMQTGEGKTLAAVPAVIWYAKAGEGVHVMTVNDYLAERDAQWMGSLYEFFGLSVGSIHREMSAEERRHAYQCDITYVTANEVGFDFLRDQLVIHPGQEVHRPFAAALIDEIDSILIDEARIPLVIAGGNSEMESLPYIADQIVRRMERFIDFSVDEHGRNVALTPTGIRMAEREFGCSNLYARGNLHFVTAIQDALNAHVLLRRDVDYVVKDNQIEAVDEFKGRIIHDRRWPAGLHNAIESKEGVPLKEQGRVLGSITLQNLVMLYPKLCGMTGTAATQAEEFQTIYELEVEVIPPHRPIVRVDEADAIFQSKHAKTVALTEEIRRTHETGRPVLVGTSSVWESEQLSRLLKEQQIPHQVLNARNEQEEATIIARAGERAAVTISTNMAGRGTDIKLGQGVAELGGLYVIGTNKHESRRIDNQLRGRAGRQGDPGGSRFFLSLEDDLLVKYGINDPAFRPDPENIQRVIEGTHLGIRKALREYEFVIEGQRQMIQRKRHAVLTDDAATNEQEHQIRLYTIDDLWAEYLEHVASLREGIHWVLWGRRDPLHEYLTAVDHMFRELENKIEEETTRRIADAALDTLMPKQRSATWTYLTPDRPFGSLTQSWMLEFNQRIRQDLLKMLGG